MFDTVMGIKFKSEEDYFTHIKTPYSAEKFRYMLKTVLIWCNFGVIRVLVSNRHMLCVQELLESTVFRASLSKSYNYWSLYQQRVYSFRK
jgi:hypothetical protein